MPSLECAVPDPERLGLLEELVDRLSAYQAGDEEDELFLGAMREALAWHVEQCPWYGEFLDAYRFSPDCLETLNDCVALPSIPSRFFRNHAILSIVPEQVHAEACVWTPPLDPVQGLPSPPQPLPRLHLDEWSVACVHRMLQGVLDHHGWLDSQEPVHYLILGREPTAGELYTDTLTEHLLCGMAPAASVTYVLKHLRGGRYEPDVVGAVERLYQLGQCGEPVRIVGLRSLLERVLEGMDEMEVPPLDFLDRGLLLLGMGSPEEPWPVERRDALDRAAHRSLGLPATRMRDCYTVLEQGVPLLECEFHRHHLPTWARAFVRHPRTREPVAPGECGLLTVLSPLVTAAPVLSLLTEDLAVVHLCDECECERQTDWVEFVGRAAAVPALQPLVPRGMCAWEGGEP